MLQLSATDGLKGDGSEQKLTKRGEREREKNYRGRTEEKLLVAWRNQSAHDLVSFKRSLVFQLH